jgi:hypothetical protein
MKKVFTATLTSTLLLALPAAAAPPGSQPGFTLAPYAWLAGIDGTIGLPGNDLDPGGDLGLFERVDFSVSEELDTVGFMFYGEWRGERWMAFFDSVWANLSQDADVKLSRVLPASDATAELDGNIYQLGLGYRLLEWDNASLTLYGGARYYDVETSGKVSGGILPGKITAKVSRSWSDAVFGGLWRYRLEDKWHGTIKADYGFGDSKNTWQAFATLGYEFGWGSVETGWRYLNLDYDNNDYRVDLSLSGPILGASFAF